MVRARQTGTKIEVNTKQPIKDIQGHAFWDHGKVDDRLRIAI